MPHTGALRWRTAVLADLPEIDRIAKIIHPDLPERAETFAEKLALSALTCLVVCDGINIRGYAIAYPWRMNDMPPLDTLFGKLPAEASVLFIHDVALLPSVRGLGLVERLLAILSAAGRKLNLEQMTLAAVYGSEDAWFRYGFRRSPMCEKLVAQSSSYGTAVYMTRAFDPE
jgi:hypothetical protein